MSLGGPSSLTSHTHEAMRRQTGSRRTRLAWLGLLAAATLVAGGCAASSGLQPVSLQKLPPRDPPARTALPQDPTGGAPAADSATAPAGVRVDCATLDLRLPGSWKSAPSDNGTAFTVSADAGGGVVNVTGMYFSGDQAQQTQVALETAVRGDDGKAVTIEQSGPDRVLAHLSVKRGGEWRLAQAFPEEKSELVKIAYAPAGGASDDRVTAATSLLRQAVGKARILDPGECDR